MKTFLNDKLDRDTFFSKFFSIKSIVNREFIYIFLFGFWKKKPFSLKIRVKYFLKGPFGNLL